MKASSPSWACAADPRAYRIDTVSGYARGRVFAFAADELLLKLAPWGAYDRPCTQYGGRHLTKEKPHVQYP
jgi:hypothetical protein